MSSINDSSFHTALSHEVIDLLSHSGEEDAIAQPPIIDLLSEAEDDATGSNILPIDNDGSIAPIQDDGSIISDLSFESACATRIPTRIAIPSQPDNTDAPIVLRAQDSRELNRSATKILLSAIFSHCPSNYDQVVAHRTLGITPLGQHPLRFLIPVVERTEIFGAFRAIQPTDSTTERLCYDTFIRYPGPVLKFLYDRTCVKAGNDKIYVYLQNFLSSRGAFIHPGTDPDQILIKRKGHTSAWYHMSRRVQQGEPAVPLTHTVNENGVEIEREIDTELAIDVCIRWADQLHTGMLKFDMAPFEHRYNFGRFSTIDKLTPETVLSMDKSKHMKTDYQTFLGPEEEVEREHKRRRLNFCSARQDKERRLTDKVVTNMFYHVIRRDPVGIQRYMFRLPDPIPVQA